jgi:Tfp pilus assembly protein PilE
MYSALLFATTQLKITPTDNTLAGFLIVVYIAGILGIIGMTAWYFAPSIYSKRKQNKAAKMEAANAIWFDSIESELHYGHEKMRIEPKSFEHFVCKITFKNPDKYHPDLSVFDEADRAKGTKETKRGVEQAVRRLNKKLGESGFKDDLFKRSKERTAVNAPYRQNIIRN